MTARWQRMGCAALMGMTIVVCPAEAASNGVPLEPESIPKFVEPLVIPPEMPPTAVLPGVTEYEISVRQFHQQVLPSGFPATTVWGYGRASDPLPGAGPSTFNFPAFTVETRTDAVVRVTWVNGLTDSSGAFLPHLLPVDQTLHWANPPGPRDRRGTNPMPYLGPIPIVTHVHGAHVPSISDGYPEAWYLPDAVNIPTGYYEQGTHYGSVHPAPAGAAVFEYPNDQRATTLWYHDHALGITRLNVYAGMAGFWLVRDDIEDGLNLPGPAPRLGDPPGTRYYEIPIAIQDRSFHEDGSLFYPDTRAFFDGEEYPGPYYPETDVPPIWNPEFFGNTIVVNGRTWPYLEVEPRLYRLRLLNGCNSRFLILTFDRPLAFHQIGNEGGLLPNAPIVLSQLLMAPAERADVIVDFSEFAVGQEVTLLNLASDEPFKGTAFKGKPLKTGFERRQEPRPTGLVMKFRVVEHSGQGNPGRIPTTLPPIERLTTSLPVRDLTLNEEVSRFADIPIAAKLGTNADGPLAWEDAVTERPLEGSVEIWRIANLTEDSHPIHLHLVQFQVIDRQRLRVKQYQWAQERWLAGMGAEPAVEDYLIGRPAGPNAWEKGWKDTVIANPGEVTQFIARFDLAGLYVWHCHILEHEDNEMMRPFEVVPRP